MRDSDTPSSESNAASAGRLRAYQYQLGPERQLTLDGSAEPLLAPERVLDQEVSASTPAGAQADWLQPDQQLPLPLLTNHPLDEAGRPDSACAEGRGWGTTFCPEHPEHLRATPRLCGCQACESSREANSKERARDAWDGTADNEADRYALRHFSSVPWGVFVWTLPAELRHLCVDDRLRRFRAEAGEMSREVLRRLGAGDGAFYVRSYLHPVGDAPGGNDGSTYEPHENVIVPLVAWREGRAHRLNRTMPRSWLGADGWVCERWRARLVSVFGQWWRGQAPPVNWFYEYRADVAKQKHALRYFGRVFPAWAHHPKVPLRPRALDLAHWKHKEELRELVASLGPPAPSYGACPHSTPAKPCPEPIHVAASTAERVLEVAELQLAEYRARRAPYLDSWRSIVWGRSAEPPDGSVRPRRLLEEADEISMAVRQRLDAARHGVPVWADCTPESEPSGAVAFTLRSLSTVRTGSVGKPSARGMAS